MNYAQSVGFFCITVNQYVSQYMLVLHIQQTQTNIYIHQIIHFLSTIYVNNPHNYIVILSG